MASQDAADAVPLPPPAEGSQPAQPLTRRRLLIALGAGGVALLGTNTGTAAASYRVGSSAASRRAQVEIGGLEAEISLLQRQLALYKDMERIGLDHLIRAALETYDRLWPPVRSAIGALRGAVKALEGGLDLFEPKLPTLRGAARLLGDLLTGMEAQVQGTQDAINELLARTGPVGEAVSGFLSWLLGKIPFGVGDRVRETADRLSALVSNVPPLIADVRHRLLEPLEGEWIGAEEADGLQAGLFDPLRENLLAPLSSHLDQVEEMASGWQEDAKSLRAALDARDAIRGELTRLERGHGSA
jgi:ABC-type transporter Mla subunit MlaD